MEKNQANKWIVFAFEDEGGTNPGEPVTGDAANITANVRIDGGAANAVDDTNPTELEDGYYVFDITAAESNGDMVLICPASSTANVNVIGVPGVVYTHPPNFNAMGIESDGHVHGDVKEILGVAQSVTDLKDFADDGYDPTTHKVQGVVLTDTCTALTGHTAQTGDSYAVVAHADYGNAKLVRSTTPANKLTVDAGGLVAVPNTQKVDVETIKTQTVTCGAGVIVGVYVGNATAALAVDASGRIDLGGWLGSVPAALADTDKVQASVQHKNSTLDLTNTEKTSVKAQVNAEVGTNGASLSAIPWNAAWDAEVESECNDALVVLHLDHLLAADYDPASKPGVATALLNELVEDDGGVSRFTANTLEQAPTGSGDDAATIYTYFTDESREDSFKADVSALALEATAQSILEHTGTTLPEAIADLPQDKTGYALTAAERNSVADAVLARDVSNNEPTGDEHTLRLMLLMAQESNTVDNEGFLTVYQTDGATEVVQKPLTTDADAEPVTGVS